MPQKTYLLPNAGGFESFVESVGRRDGSESPPPLLDDQEGMCSERSSSSSSLVASEFYSPVSVLVDPPPVVPDDACTEEERIATAPVQGLLDNMNQASCKMMECEQEIHTFEQCRREIALEWHSRKSQLISEIGVHAIEKARPIFDAYEQQLQLQQSVNEASVLYNQAVIECEEMKQALNTANENGSTESHLGQLLGMLVSVQTKRDTYEHLSLDRTNEFKLAQTTVIELRRQIGLRTVERAWPWFEAFLQSKGQSEELTGKIHLAKKQMAGLREGYRDAMQELEAISAKVHAIRKRLEENSNHNHTS